MNENDLFRTMIYEYMLNISDTLERDRISVLNRISLNSPSADDIYSIIVVETRQDFSRSVFRSFREIMKEYLS